MSFIEYFCLFNYNKSTDCQIYYIYINGYPSNIFLLLQSRILKSLILCFYRLYQKIIFLVKDFMQKSFPEKRLHNYLKLN